MMKGSIGILGGMGPLATADLFRKIVLMTQADRDSGHIRIFIDNNPQIPDRTAAILQGGEDPVPQMLAALKNLELCRPSCIVMPCNTAHYFIDRLREHTDIPFIHMLDETAKRCAALFPGKTAGVWGTKGTLQSGLYTRALEAQGVRSILPDAKGQDTLMDLIYRVKGGEMLRDRAPLAGLMEEMCSRGADYFILGCTELPIVIEQLCPPGDFIDPTAELARAAIEFCGYRVKQ